MSGNYSPGPIDIFVSHAKEDSAVAEQVVTTMEARGFRCWIALRDIPPGSAFETALVRAIRASRVMVVVWSDAASQSRHVQREVRIASEEEGLTILPLRIEQAPMSEVFLYHLSGSQWFDASSPPTMDHLKKLADGVARVLARSSGNDDAGRRGEENPDPNAFRYEDYWKAFKAALARSGSRLRPPTVRDKNWVRFPAGGAGAAINAFATRRERYIGVELALDRAEHSATFQSLRAARAEIEREMGRELKWKEHEASYRIVLTETGRDPTDPADWPRQHAWFGETLDAFYAVLVKRLGKGLAPAPDAPYSSGDEPREKTYYSPSTDDM
jgi:hypothetical protein